MFMINRSSVTRIFAPLITSLSTLVLLTIPGRAFTLSSSETTFTINNFSNLPLNVTALRDTNTQAIAPDGLIKSNANADALFLTDASNPSSSAATGSASSVVNGRGNNYFGLAQSVAKVIGYTFEITSGETFSFDFNSSLKLNTSVDQPGIETATAIGIIGLGLYDSADPTNLTLLDFLTISGNLGTPDNSAGLTVDQSAGITFNSKQTSLEQFLGGNQASASASVQGRLSRSFPNQTSLTLIEYSVSESTSAAVPEPSNVLASVVCIGGLGIRYWRKLKPNQP
jgi:hypothetical protein